MKTVKNILDKVTSYASVFIFIMMVLMVTYQVVARYIFSAPSSVTEILTRYSFVWLIIISATYMFGQREHINIAVVKDKLPKKAKRIVNIIIECVILKPPNTIIRPANAIVTHSIIILTILLAFLGSLSFTAYTISDLNLKKMKHKGTQCT